MAPTLWLSEVFGPTLQGEGPSAGQRSIFVRTANCNLDCAWCDSRHSWDWASFDKATARYQQSVEELAAKVTELAGGDPCRVVFTGGEPMLQQAALGYLAQLLWTADQRWRFDIETNGTIALHQRGPESGAEPLGVMLDVKVVSPKIASSGVDQSRAINLDVLRSWRDHAAHLKIVVTCPADLDAAGALRDELQWPHRRSWLMGEGMERDEALASMSALAPLALERGWNVSGRLHTFIWGNERGR